MRKITFACFALAASLSLPAQQQSSPNTSPTPSNPTHNNPDVPAQHPDTSNPDIAPQNQPAPGGTGVPAKKSRKRKNRQNTSTSSTKSTT